MIKIGAAISYFVIGMVLFFGLFLFLKGARNIQWAMASTKWPSTPGVVIRSDTVRDVTRGTRRTAGSVTFDTTTVIQYVVDGRTHTTNVLHFGQTLGSSDKSEAALQRIRYPRGKPVAVSYNRANPSIAVMTPGLHADAFWLPGAGLAFLLPAVLCLFAVPLMWRSIPRGDSDFANSVQAAIDAARRNEPVPLIPMPPRDSGDKVMTAAAIGFGAVACCLGVLALTAGIERAWHGYASQSWPTTAGVVVMSGEVGPGDSTDSAAYARFVYRYDVAGATHFNNLRRFAQVEGGSVEDAARIASLYRNGADVKVSYFPADPDIAVLEPGNTGASLWLPGIGVVLLLFSLATFVWVVPAVAR
ncbi:MAG: DUF3592 domain-containing protein [Candidatus Sulfopaludibacter sp.]|nr:DUF3592 domain-containing protein [Candidatus Sulfopaludibacter sp.]